MSEEWSNWFLHDGKGCPCAGCMVEAVFERATYSVITYSVVRTRIDPPELFIAGSGGGQSWDWSNWPKHSRILRYRIRKPRGLTILENLIADLPAPVGPKVDA